MKAYSSAEAIPPTLPMRGAAETFPRQMIEVYSGMPQANQRLAASVFRARETRTYSQIGSSCAETVAIGLTLAQMAVFAFDPDTRECELIAACASDTSLWTGTFTEYVRNLTAPARLVRGRYYAAGVLIDGTSQAPKLTRIAPWWSATLSRAPMVNFLTPAAHAVMPASFTAPAAADGNGPYLFLLP